MSPGRWGGDETSLGIGTSCSGWSGAPYPQNRQFEGLIVSGPAGNLPCGAIKVVDGDVEVISEGTWKLLNPDIRVDGAACRL